MGYDPEDRNHGCPVGLHSDRKVLIYTYRKTFWGYPVSSFKFLSTTWSLVSYVEFLGTEKYTPFEILGGVVMSVMTPVAVVTGGASGIGEACARRF